MIRLCLMYDDFFVFPPSVDCVTGESYCYEILFVKAYFSFHVFNGIRRKKTKIFHLVSVRLLLFVWLNNKKGMKKQTFDLMTLRTTLAQTIFLFTSLPLLILSQKLGSTIARKASFLCNSLLRIIKNQFKTEVLCLLWSWFVENLASSVSKQRYLQTRYGHTANVYRVSWRITVL